MIARKYKGKGRKNMEKAELTQKTGTKEAGMQEKTETQNAEETQDTKEAQAAEETKNTVTQEKTAGETPQKGGKGTLIMGLAAAAVAVCLIVLVVLFMPKPQSGDKSITVTLTDNSGVETVYEHNTDAEYLLDAVREIEGLELQGEEGEYGFFITAVNGITADYSIDQSYWAIYVNGDYGSYGIELQPIEDGGVYALVYERSSEE